MNSGVLRLVVGFLLGAGLAIGSLFIEVEFPKSDKPLPPINYSEHCIPECYGA